VSDDRERAEELRQMMVRQTSRIVAMLDQLLDMARLVSGRVQLELVEVDLAEIIQRAIETLRPRLSEHQLTVRLPTDRSVLVRGDAVRLAEVVENLLSNAISYTAPGGRIEVALETEGETARILIQDSGSGMRPELLPHVFEVFTQGPRALDRAKGGLGLGLALVQRLVLLHGGRVSAESPGEDKGSTFIVQLPCRIRRHSTPAESHPGDSMTRTPERQVAPRRILVVDDERDTAEVLAELLEARGHTALAVHDGPSALEAARQFKPEVILLDLGLPEMDGYEVARELRRDYAGQPLLLVAVTGYQRDPVRLARAGFDHHLLKPPTARKLATLLAELDDDADVASRR
jgi:CheY-like chemotaxis protein/two-component sensor histidine kinase